MYMGCACPALLGDFTAIMARHLVIAQTAALQLPVSIVLNLSVLQQLWTSQQTSPATANASGSSAPAGPATAAENDRRVCDQQQPEGRRTESHSQKNSQSVPLPSIAQQRFTARLETAAAAISRIGLVPNTQFQANHDSQVADAKSAFLLLGQVEQACAQVTEPQACLRLQMAAHGLLLLTSFLGDAVRNQALAALRIMCCHTALPPALLAQAWPAGATAPSMCQVPFCDGASSGAPLLLAALPDLFAAAAVGAPSKERGRRRDGCLRFHTLLRDAFCGLGEPWASMVPPPPPLLPTVEDAAAQAASDAMMHLLLEVRLCSGKRLPIFCFISDLLGFE